MLERMLTTANGTGHVRLINYMGSDLTHVNAARASFNKEKKEFGAGDIGLTKFLAHADIPHTSPFRHAYITFQIKAPIFVARQWWKHIVGANYTELDTHPFNDTGWNEQSGRYVAYDDYWAPEYFRLASENKKQGSIDTPHPHNQQWLDMYREHTENGIRMYEAMIADGVAHEQARALLGLNMYTNWYWTASFLAVAHFVNLRDHPDAQLEIKEYAMIIDDIMKDIFPVSWSERKGLH